MKKLDFFQKHAGLVKNLLYGLTGLVAFIVLSRKFTFGFVPLFMLLVLFLLFPLIVRPKKPTVYAVMIVLFGGVAMYALDNYINPERDVFANNDHHALRLDGVVINNPVGENFVLAGDSKDAFFDDDLFNGSLSVVGLTESSVILRSKGFTRPVYTKRFFEGKYSDMRTNLVMNKGTHPVFSANEEVVLYSRSRDEKGRRRKISFSVYEIDSGKRELSDSSFYVFDGSDTSSRHTFLRNSLPLSDLAADVVLDFDPVGISVIRDFTNTEVPKSRLVGMARTSPFKKKQNGVYFEKNYSFDIDSRADVSEISINGISYRPDKSDAQIEIPFNVPFYIGSGMAKTESMVFRKRHQGDTLCLEYELPRYRYLSSSENKDENTLMITTTLFDPTSSENLELTPAYTDNILLFDVFDKQGNRNQLSTSYISFVGGESSELLDYDFITSDSRSAGQRSLDYMYRKNGADFAKMDDPSDNLAFSIKTRLAHIVPTIGNPGVSWMISVENFKETTPFSSRNITLLLFAVVMVCSFILIYKIQSSNFFSVVEYTAYLILIAFLAIRLFLMWRTTVFPPVTAISNYEFNHFRTAVPIGWLIGSFSVFAVIVMLTKMLMSRKKTLTVPDFPWLRKLLTPQRNMYIAIVAGYVLGFLSSHVLPAERITNIMIPVATAMVFEMLIHWLYARTYIHDIRKRDPRNPVGSRRDAILMSMLNLCLASGVTFIKDGGYGVMFMIFTLLFLVYKFLDLRLYTPRNRNSSKATICKYLLFIFVITIFALYKDLFIFMFNNRAAFCVVAFVFILVIAGLVFVVLDVQLDFRRHGWIVATSVLGTAIACCGLYFVLGGEMDGTHMEYRIRVHMDSAENTLAYHIKSQEAQNKFMQASINDWILDEYEEIGKEIRVLGEDGTGYFKMQPQSKLGALWFAQTTDIVLSRFIIAEHSQLLAIMFIIAFVMMLAIGLMAHSEHRWTKMIMVMVPLLFATQAMLIWLATTGRFIFFGQDFPLISVTSKLSIIYFFFLLLVLVVASLVEKIPYAVKKDPADRQIIDRNNISLTAQIILIFAFMMMVFLFTESLFIYEALIVYVVVVLLWNYYGKRKKKEIGTRQSDEEEEVGIMSTLPAVIAHIALFAALALCFFQINKINRAPDKMHGEYEVGELMKATNADIEAINPYLKEYQKEHPMTLKTDMYDQMSGFKKYLDQQSIPCLDEKCDSVRSFTRVVLDEFFKDGCRHNTVSNLVYLRNERSYNAKGVAADTLILALKADYFRLKLPKRTSIGWKGNIIEHQNQAWARNGAPVSLKNNELLLTGDCVRGGHDVLLVSAAGGERVRVLGSDAIVDISARNLPVARVNATDVLLKNGRAVESSLDKVNYFAQNVMINGQRTFLYPRGSELFWMREFASQIQSAKNSAPKKHRRKDDFHDDVAVTLDGELVSAIYSLYMENQHYRGGDRTVVVADGDGHIKAMVDFRKRDEYRLNPNDSKTITAVSEQLQLNGELGKAKERMYFENMAASPLRLGPGSSQKPLTWTAVSSGYNTGWWEELAVAPIRNDKLYTKEDAGAFSPKDREKIKRGRYLFRHFAGHRIQASFNSIKNDEGAAPDRQLPITLDYFIRRSSNFYNGVLAYLGSFPVDGYYANNSWMKVSDENDQQTLFRKCPSITNRMDAAQYDSLFPILNLGSKGNVVFNAFLEKEFAMDTTALLPSGLSRNLGLRPYTFTKDRKGKMTRTRPTAGSLYPSVRRFMRRTGDKMTEAAAAVPSRSYFNLTAREGHYRDREMNENMVRSVAIGNNTAWHVSPLKMAEMYGRMIALNRNYNLTLDPDVTCKYIQFELDESWYSLENYHKARKGMLTGMSQNFQSDKYNIAMKGQASGARPNLVELDTVPVENVKKGKKVQGMDEGKYYIYGKTGTIDGKYCGIDMEDHLLAVVITDTKLTTCSSDDLENVRFYVVYLADYGELIEENGRLKAGMTYWTGIDKSILDAVISSRDFQNYMNSPKEL